MLNEWLERKYIMLLSSSLPLFVEKGDNVYNFRCVLCGDSEKNTAKARGYLIEKQGKFYSYCHNCHASMPFDKFLEHVNPILYKQYLEERFIDTPRRNVSKSQPLRVEKEIDSLGIPSVMWLDVNHPARQYIAKRGIPVRWYSRLFYAENFNEFANTHVKEKYDPNRAEPRIVIPFRSRSGKLLGFQGRSLNPNANIRYITALLSPDNPKLFNMDLVDLNSRNYALEGPFDAMMLKNAFSACGGSILSEIRKAELNTSNTVIVYDNEPRNRDIVRSLYAAIKAEFSVVIWPRRIEQKDVNDMVLNGVADIESVLSQHTYKGLEAESEFGLWKKIA